MRFQALGICTLLVLSTAAVQPAGADDLRRLFGTIAGEIVKEQMRQPRSQQPQPQVRQAPQAGTRQQVQPQARQRSQTPAAPQPQQPQMSLEERMALQRALAAAGHYSGEIDGILGPNSRRAIAGWQASLGAAATGYLLPQQAGILIAGGSAQYAAPAPATAAVPNLFGTPKPNPATAFAAPAPVTAPVTSPVTADVPQLFGTPAPGAATPFAASEQAFAAAPATGGPTPFAGSGPPSDALIGDDDLGRQLMIWSAATVPALIEDQLLIFRLVNAGLAPDILQNRVTDPTLKREAIRAALPGPDMPAPVRAILEREARIHPAWDGNPPRLGTVFPDIDGIPTITEVKTIERGRSAGRGAWTFRLARPFYLPPPEGFEAWAIPPNRDDKTKLLLQIDLSMSDLVPASGAWEPRYDGGAGVAQINRVSLIRRPPPARRAGDPVLPDEVLHVWTGEAPALSGPDRPANSDALAALFGGAASGGRYVARPHDAGPMFYASDVPRPLLPIEYGTLQQGLALRRLVAADGDRMPDMALTQFLSNTFLTERERIELLPVELTRPHSVKTLSQLEIHAAYSASALSIRDIALARMPDLPLPMRWIGQTSLSEYDFTTGGFFLPLGGSIYSALPLGGPRSDIVMDTTLVLPPAEAQALEQRVAQANPASGRGRNRQLFVVVDYTLDDVAPRAPGSGPITQAGLQTLTPRSRVESAAIYLDATLTQKLMDLPLAETAESPQTPGASEAPPEAIYATTGQSLWGAVARMEGGDEVVADVVGRSRLFGQNGRAITRERAAAVTAEFKDAALDAYWVGLGFTPGQYDPSTRRLQISNLSFRSVPYDNDITGMEPPSLVAGEDYGALQVAPEDAEAIAALAASRGGVTAYAQVRPMGLEHNDWPPALTVSLPDIMLFGPGQGHGIPDRVALRVTMQAAAPPQISAPAQAITPPEALLLDQEGIDLLALSVDPQIHDEDAWRRMLLARLLQERWWAMEGDPGRSPLAWSNFFADPQLTPDAGGVTALLPAFRDWTMARVAALPPLVLLPQGTVPQNAPHCTGMRDLPRSQIEAGGDFYLTQALALVGPDATPADLPQAYSDRPRPGQDRLWLHNSDPRRVGCRYPKQIRAGQIEALMPKDTTRISALVGLRGMPGLGPVAMNAAATGVVLRRETLRLAPVDGLPGRPDGLRAVLVAAGPVEQVIVWQPSPTGRGHGEARTLTPQDWMLPEAVPPAATDIVGLTLGTPLEAWDAAARAHLGEAVLFTTDQPGQGMFGHARGLLHPQTGETLLAVYAPFAEGQPVVAIMRRLNLPAEAGNIEALQLSLTGKYGPIARELREGHWLWGTLPEGEDGWGLCGGSTLLGGPERRDAPTLAPVGDPALPEDSPALRPDSWVEAGWPAVVTGRPGLIDPARCAPVIAARVMDSARQERVLQVWAMDRKLAGELDTLPKPAPQPADIKL